ncbi:hypothetical protein [Streptomyces sp. KLOTTS4A1]|uniref:hypothetical protein n=1 Tax=Streptomyces sp. KLOTTS4A1 TaxID=3390996 RepID=UPI0039F51542
MDHRSADDGRHDAEPVLPLEELAATEQWAGSAAAPSASRGVRPDGTTHVVEVQSVSGMHTVTGIGPHGSGPPSEAARVELRSAALALLDLMGHADGGALVEVVLTDRGPQVVSCTTGVDAE